MRALGLIVVAIVVALAAAVGVKTIVTPSRQVAVRPATPAPVDAQAVAARLAAALKWRTIASPIDAAANAGEFEGFRAMLQSSFPKLHATLQRESLDGGGLLYTWKGSDVAAPAFALMAHQDVVPIAPGTESDWQRPAFAGMIDGGYVWGRGAWDDKGNLMSIMEAAEALVASGFRPRQTIYLAFGADEEIGGARGAARIGALLRNRGVHLQFVVDEGLLITEGMLKGLKPPAALIGVAEKGALSLRLTATATPGHSSIPPAEAGASAIGMLSIALARLEANPMPLELTGLSRRMLETLGPEMSGFARVALTNLWLFKPLVERQMAGVASTSASMRTTTALTVVNAGQAENVLPGRAMAIVNFRLRPGDSSDAVVRHVTETIFNPAIGVEKMSGWWEATRVASTDAPGYRAIERSIRQLHPEMIVSPGLMLGGTDSRHFDGLADDVYKFSPVRATAADLERFHGTNERISIANYVEMIQFYQRLIQNAQAAQPAAQPAA